MKRLALVAPLSALAFPAVAQALACQWGLDLLWATDWLHLSTSNSSGEISDIARQQLQRFQQRSTTCTTYGNERVCE